MGRRVAQQDEMFLPLARGQGHRFYEALSALLSAADFDSKVEALCAEHYGAATAPGRPSLAPGIYFRMVLIGYFEGIGSERGIAWRCADSMSLRDFLGLSPHQAVADHSTVSRTRRRLPAGVFVSFFQLVLQILDEKGLFKGKVQGVDSTYLKADASMQSIVRKDGGTSYRDYIKGLAAEDSQSITDEKAPDVATAEKAPDVATAEKAPDVATAEKAPDVAAGEKAPDVDDDKLTPPKQDNSNVPAGKKASTEEAVRHDRKRKKTTSNKDWESKSDPDARIMRIKDGTTRLAYKAEHVVDMETGAILAAEVYNANSHDTATLEDSLDAAQENMSTVIANSKSAGKEDTGESSHNGPLAEIVADKGYHKAALLLSLKKKGYRTYIPEKAQRGKRHFNDKGGNDAAQAFHQNRARTTREKGKALQRKRGELLERPNQHLYDRGGLRTLTVTGKENVTKRVLMQAAAFNLGLAMRNALGAGTPKWLAALFHLFALAQSPFKRFSIVQLFDYLWNLVDSSIQPVRPRIAKFGVSTTAS